MKQYTAKTLEELLANAAEELGCEVSDLTYIDVVENKGGLLGIGANVTATVFTSEDVKDFLFDYLGDFFTGIDQDLEVSIEERNGSYIVRMDAENNAVLIGKMGKTLSAFNTIVRSAVNATFKKRIDVLIDVNNYKEDRYARLASMAKRTAKQVSRSHIEAELDPMPNDERKVIHQTLNDWRNIETHSVGEGANRHVVISYKEDEVTEEAE